MNLPATCCITYINTLKSEPASVTVASHFHTDVVNAIILSLVLFLWETQKPLWGFMRTGIKAIKLKQIRLPAVATPCSLSAFIYPAWSCQCISSLGIGYSILKL